MQKLILRISIGLYFCVSSMACDVCSGPSDASNMGILPQFQRNFIGIRYSCKCFRSTQPKSILIPGNNRSANEVTQVGELWGRYVFRKRFQVYAFLPIQKFTQKFSDSVFNNKGFGELSLSVNYMILNTGDSICDRFKQALFIGVGVKFPSANYRKSISDLMQIGSGSVDATVSINHTLRFAKYGFMSEGTYRFNGSGYGDFKYGKKLTISSKIFLLQKIKKVSVLPNFGLTWEYSAKSRHHEIIQWNTGGSALLSGIGCDVFYKQLIFSMNAQQAVYQNLADGYLTSKIRMTAGVRLSF